MIDLLSTITSGILSKDLAQISCEKKEAVLMEGRIIDT